MARLITFFALLALAMLLVIDAEAAINVDGNLADWGVSPNGSNILTYTGGIVNNTDPRIVYPTPGNGHGKITNFWGTSSLYYHAEDTSTKYVGPNWGGQNYDSEFLGAITSNGKLYLGIATGQRPDNGFAKFSPGDIRIAVSDLAGTDIYGVEVGGGPGTYRSKWTTPDSILAGDPGTTYDVRDNGSTLGFLAGDGSGAFKKDGTSYTPSNPLLNGPVHDPAQKAGSVWLTDPGDWINDPIPPPLPVQFQVSGGSAVGASTDFVYQFADIGPVKLGEHAFMELSLDLATLGLDPVLPGATMEIAWRPSCGNDDSWLSVEVPMPPPPVPEPTSVVVWSLLILTIGGCGWRQRRRR